MIIGVAAIAIPTSAPVLSPPPDCLGLDDSVGSDVRLVALDLVEEAAADGLAVDEVELHAELVVDVDVSLTCPTISKSLLPAKKVAPFESACSGARKTAHPSPAKTPGNGT